VVAFALLGLKSRGHRPFEAAIVGLLAVILLGFVYSVALGRPDPSGVVTGLTPQFAGTDSVLLAAGMLGATVMPHAIYLHSSLTSGRYLTSTPELRRTLLRSQRLDVVVAMTLAG